MEGATSPSKRKEKKNRNIKKNKDSLFPKYTTTDQKIKASLTQLIFFLKKKKIITSTTLYYYENSAGHVSLIIIIFLLSYMGNIISIK